MALPIRNRPIYTTPKHERDSLLRVSGVTKRFGGLAALEDVSLDVRLGEIYGLIGPNGAGKTTLFNCMTGLYSLTAGEVKLDGAALQGLKPHQIVERGFARTFQNIRLFANMTAWKTSWSVVMRAVAPASSARFCAIAARAQKKPIFATRRDI
jgi:ABC-type branched-subunit amino acid transport system ATPase component